MSPVEAQVETIARRLRAPDTITAGKLVQLLGKSSYPLVTLILSILNMIPGPPGYGGTLALAIITATVAMLLGKPLELGGWIGHRKLSPKLIERMLGQMQWFDGLVARVSKPRMLWLTGPRTERPLGLFVLAVSLPMVIPIPFINAVPNTGIALISVSRINRDGLGVILGIIVALIGLLIAFAAIYGAVMLAKTVLA